MWMLNNDSLDAILHSIWVDESLLAKTEEGILYEEASRSISWLGGASVAAAAASSDGSPFLCEGEDEDEVLLLEVDLSSSSPSKLEEEEEHLEGEGLGSFSCVV